MTSTFTNAGPGRWWSRWRDVRLHVDTDEPLDGFEFMPWRTEAATFRGRWVRVSRGRRIVMRTRIVFGDGDEASSCRRRRSTTMGTVVTKTVQNVIHHGDPITIHYTSTTHGNKRVIRIVPVMREQGRVCGVLWRKVDAAPSCSHVDVIMPNTMISGIYALGREDRAGPLQVSTEDSSPEWVRRLMELCIPLGRTEAIEFLPDGTARAAQLTSGCPLSGNRWIIAHVPVNVTMTDYVSRVYAGDQPDRRPPRLVKKVKPNHS